MEHDKLRTSKTQKEFDKNLDLPSSTEARPNKSSHGMSTTVAAIISGGIIGGLGASVDHYLHSGHNCPKLEPATTHSQPAPAREKIDTRFVDRAKLPADSHAERSAAGKGNETGAPAR